MLVDDVVDVPACHSEVVDELQCHMAFLHVKVDGEVSQGPLRAPLVTQNVHSEPTVNAAAFGSLHALAQVELGEVQRSNTIEHLLDLRELEQVDLTDGNHEECAGMKGASVDQLEWGQVVDHAAP